MNTVRQRKRLFLILFSLTALLLFSGCTAEDLPPAAALSDRTANETDIKTFEYTYTAFPNDFDWNVRIEEKDGVPVLTCWTFADSEYGSCSVEISREVLQELKQLYMDNQVYLWNGFNAPMDTNICDGDFYTLLIEFEDGKDCRAQGYFRKPDHYAEFIKGVKKTLQPDMERALDLRKQEVTAEGFEGLPAFFSFSYDNGAENYYDKEYCQFFFSRNSDGTVNLDTTVHSGPGKYLGEFSNAYYIYDNLPADAIDFEKIDALIRKYELLFRIRNGKSYVAGKEFFSVNAQYDSGNLKVFADLTDPEEKAFMNEFLLLMSEMLPETVRRYDLKEFSFSDRSVPSAQDASADH